MIKIHNRKIIVHIILFSLIGTSLVNTVNSNESKDTGLHCYACGAPIREKDTACKKCGAEL